MPFKLFSSFFQFLPLQVEETYFFRDGLNRGLIRFLPPGGRNLPTLLTHSHFDLNTLDILMILSNKLLGETPKAWCNTDVTPMLMHSGPFY